MSDKTKRILAFIGLFFMAVFSVVFVIFLITRNNVTAFIALFSFVSGLAILFIINMYKKKAESQAEFLQEGDAEDKQDNQDEIEQTASADTQAITDNSQEKQADSKPEPKEP